MEINENIKLIVIDAFCGAGGVTQGFHNAKIDGESCVAVVIGINHDKKAIESHAANHPETIHFTEDFRKVNVNSLVSIVDDAKIKYPNAKVMFWMSAECTHHSIAKGGMSRDADSRSLPEYAYSYIEILKPDIVGVENVKEFLNWGPLEIKIISIKGRKCCPLDKKRVKGTNKYTYSPVWIPMKERKGEYYNKWVKTIKSFGYEYEYSLLNAADYGAYTSRIRYFGIFAQDNQNIKFPVPTHSKTGTDGFKKYKAVKEVLDLSDRGESMFDRKIPLVENTWKRVYPGLIRFVAGGKEEFMLKWNSMQANGTHVPPSVDEPCHTVTTQNRLGMCFISKAYSGHPDSKNISVNEPAGAITTIDHHQFITAYYGNGYNIPIDIPASTITTKDRLGLIHPIFIDNQYGASKPTSAFQPLGSLTTIPKQNLIICDHYLVNPQYNSEGSSIDKPCFTLIARMDKRPPSVVSVTCKADKLPSFIRMGDNTIVYEIYNTDSETMRLVKEFMALYGLVDITMRMLKILELLQIMGFPIDYELIGTQADQKKFIGNAVECTQSQVLAEAICNTI